MANEKTVQDDEVEGETPDDREAWNEGETLTLPGAEETKAEAFERIMNPEPPPQIHAQPITEDTVVDEDEDDEDDEE